MSDETAPQRDCGAEQWPRARPTFTTPDYFLWLRRMWIAADEQDRRHFLTALGLNLADKVMESTIRLRDDETKAHFQYQIDDAIDLPPIVYVHRYWRQVSPEDRLRFLCEMLTPAERRALQYGFDDETT